MRMTHWIGVMVLLSFCLSANAGQIVTLNAENWNLVPGGKEVDAIYGDYLLKNDKVVAVIGGAAPNRHANLMTLNVQGAVIDFTLLETNNDQLTAYQPHAFAGVFPKADAGPTNGGYNNPGPAADRIEIVKADGPEVSLRVTLKPTAAYPIEIVTTYTLRDGDQFLGVITTRKNVSDKPFTVRLTERLKHEKPAAFAGVGEQQVVFSYDRYFGGAYGVVRTDGKPLAVPTPPVVPAQQKGAFGLFDYPDLVNGKGPGSAEIAPGAAITQSRMLIAGRDAQGVQTVADNALNQRTKSPLVVNAFDYNGNPIANIPVTIYAHDAWEKAATPALRKSLAAVTFAFTDLSGHVQFAVRGGKYMVVIDSPGRAVFSRSIEVPALIRDDKPGANPAAELFAVPATCQAPIGESSQVSFSITDGDNHDSPVKVQFIGQGTTPNPDLGPDQRADGCHNLWYSTTGKFDVPLPPGDYYVLLSRGPEYDAVWRTIKLVEGKTVNISARLPHVVDTKGWISADFHNHTTLSGDNSTQTEGRLATLIAEGVEFAAATEHQRVTSYKPFLKVMKAEALMATSDGMELTGTPLPLDHQNAFPMHVHPHTQFGGGPMIDGDPRVQIKRLKDADDGAEKLVQQNHPDIGWLVYDRDGDGKPDGGFGTLEYTDVIEIFETTNALSLKPLYNRQGNKENNRFLNWLQLINQGYRIPGVANTDAHICFHESGIIRNWVKSPTDVPAEVKEMDVVRESKKGHLIMSSGPFLEVSLNDAGPGDDVKLAGGEGKLKIRVQCPNWFDVSRVQVLINGKVDPNLTFTRATHPKRFADGVVKFDQTLPIKLPADAAIIVIAADEHGSTGPVMGGGDIPIAISNPIFVDVDGDGFKPNRDTLGSPLPTKPKKD